MERGKTFRELKANFAILLQFMEAFLEPIWLLWGDPSQPGGTNPRPGGTHPVTEPPISAAGCPSLGYGAFEPGSYSSGCCYLQ